MKRFFLAIVALFYLATSVGATFRIHYCMGEFVEWTLLNKKGENCNNCGMQKGSKASKDCCKDVQKNIKLDKHDRSAESYFEPIKLCLQPIYLSAVELSAGHIFSGTPINLLGNPPPRDRSVAIYLRHCVFLI